MADSEKGSKLICCDEGRIKMFIDQLGQDLNLKSNLKQSVSTKNAKVSLQFLYVGDYFFATEESPDLEPAIAEFTKSIAYAPPRSPELAQAYAGRSAVLFKARLLSDCLLDIERALQYKYGDVMKPDFFLRRVICIRTLDPNNTSRMKMILAETEKLLAKFDPRSIYIWREMLDQELKSMPVGEFLFAKWDTEKFVPKLESENPIFPGLSGAVDVRYSEKYGRHLIAKRKIKPGEVLMVQKPYAKTTLLNMRYKICWNCGGQSWAGVPCDNCPEVIFCSEACKEKGNLEHHDFECPVIGHMIAFEMKDGLLLSLRIVVKALREMGGSFEALKNILAEVKAETNPLKRGFTNNIFDPTKFASVFSLERHIESLRQHEDVFITNSVVIAYFLATKTEFFGRKLHGSLSSFKDNKNFIFLVELLTWNFEMIATNAHNIGFRKAITERIETSCAITPLFSLLNHSCRPMLLRNFYKDYDTSTASCVIEEGEQICGTYGIYFYEKPKEERQNVFTKLYNFTCDCEACRDDWPVHVEEKYDFKEPTCTQFDKIAKKLIITSRLADSYGRKHDRLPNVSNDIANLTQLITDFHSKFHKSSAEICQGINLLNGYLRLTENRFLSLN